MNIEYIKDYKVKPPNINSNDNKNFITIALYVASRGGTKSPYTYYFKYKGRWITPYAQKKHGWGFPAGMAF